MPALRLLLSSFLMPPIEASMARRNKPDPDQEALANTDKRGRDVLGSL